MTRNVLVFRHAKSDRSGFHGDDFVRPLNQRGILAARRMGELLAAAGQVPELVLCSTAVRTRETLQLAMAAGDWDVTVRHLEVLYLAEARTMAQALRDTPAQVSSVMLVAHEPGCSELLRLLVGGGAHRMPTAAMARVDMNITDWSATGRGRGELAWLLPPRFLHGNVPSTVTRAG